MTDFDEAFLFKAIEGGVAVLPLSGAADPWPAAPIYGTSSFGLARGVAPGMTSGGRFFPAKLDDFEFDRDGRRSGVSWSLRCSGTTVVL